MPQLDFRQALSSPTDPAFPATAECCPRPDPISGKSFPGERFVSANRFSSLGLSDWASLLFAIVAFAGGLICAFWFFNGAELMRAAAAWPGELFYGPPPSVAVTSIIQKSHRVGDAAHAGGSSEGPSDRKKKPFDPNSRPFVDLSPFAAAAGANEAVDPIGAPFTPPSVPPSPALPPAISPPPGSSLLDVLNPVVAGADALSQFFDQGVANLAQTKLLEAKRTVVVVKTAPSELSIRRATARLKAEQQRTGNVTSVAGKTAQAARQNLRSASQGLTSSGSSAAAGTINQTAGSIGAVSASVNSIGNVGAGISATSTGVVGRVTGTVGSIAPSGGVAGRVGGLVGGGAGRH